MFTLICMIFGWSIFVDLLVMFWSSKGNKHIDMPATWRPFSHLDSLDQKLHSFGPPLGQAVQEASASVTNYFSRLIPGGGKVSSKFNFGGCMGLGGGNESSGDGIFEAA